ncbi:MAG: VWA domain-containing protein [bacterium]
MRFNNPEWFFAFFVWFPLVIIYFMYAVRLKKHFLRIFSESQNLRILNTSKKLIWTKRILLVLILILLNIAAARPQSGESEINLESSGIDISVAFDVSMSMLAEDEDGSRIKKGKHLLMDAVASLSGDRIALIPFSGSAFLQLPLTSDYNTALSLISSLEPGMIKKPGTSLTSALELAVSALTSGEKKSDRLIILISDGEDPAFKFDMLKEMLSENNIYFAILPLGTPEGAPVKAGESYMRDKNDEVVISRLNKDFFEKCAAVLDAHQIKSGRTLSSYISSFKQKVNRSENRMVIYQEKFQLPLGAAILLFFLFLIIPSAERREI